MRTCVNLVAILMTLAILASALDPLSLDPAEGESEDRSASLSRTRDGHFVRKSKRPVALKMHRPLVTAGTSDVTVKKIGKKGSAKVAKGGTKVAKGGAKVANTNKLALIHDLTEKTKVAAKNRETRKRRRTMNRAMIALLMAYKLKFATLVPTLLGGLILLVGNTALAGFFFALFAAVLGLKH